MSKQFIKKGDLQLINGGYLSNKENNPVSNAEFVSCQLHAEYIVAFAKIAKNKDFSGKKADSIEDLKKEVIAFVNNNRATVFVATPNSVKRPTSNSLASEALAFINFQESSSKVDKINGFLQQFKVLAEYEEFGLFFDEDIVKLNNIYTMKEVVAAVTATIDLLK